MDSTRTAGSETALMLLIPSTTSSACSEEWTDGAYPCIRAISNWGLPIRYFPYCVIGTRCRCQHRSRQRVRLFLHPHIYPHLFFSQTRSRLVTYRLPDSFIQLCLPTPFYPFSSLAIHFMLFRDGSFRSIAPPPFHWGNVFTWRCRCRFLIY
jgi:hypothetical protein